MWRRTHEEYVAATRENSIAVQHRGTVKKKSLDYFQMLFSNRNTKHIEQIDFYLQKKNTHRNTSFLARIIFSGYFVYTHFPIGFSHQLSIFISQHLVCSVCAENEWFFSEGSVDFSQALGNEAMGVDPLGSYICRRIGKPEEWNVHGNSEKTPSKIFKIRCLEAILEFNLELMDIIGWWCRYYRERERENNKR